MKKYFLGFFAIACTLVLHSFAPTKKFAKPCNDPNLTQLFFLVPVGQNDCELAAASFKGTTVSSSNVQSTKKNLYPFGCFDESTEVCAVSFRPQDVTYNILGDTYTVASNSVVDCCVAKTLW